MTKFGSKIAFASTAYCLFATAAQAAEPTMQIEYVSGKVLVNAGTGFRPADAASVLKAGDRLLIGKDSTITVTFNAAQCSISYASASIVVVPEKAPCKPGDTLAAVGNDFAVPANAAGVAVVGAAVDTTIPVTIGIAVEGAGLLAAGYVAATTPAATGVSP
jgi:uncharacterized ferredoxin-like protein